MNKTMVITGASSGVGRDLALYFAEQDYTVCAIGRNKKNLAEIQGVKPDKIIPYSCDITNAKEVEKVFKKITTDQKKINVLVNNAAVFQMRDFADQDIDIIDSIIDTNLKGLMYVTHFALPSLLKNKHAHIINIASVAGTHGIPQQSIYCASKHGVVGFGDVLAQELLDKGVKVVTICPGGIKTRLWTSGDNPYPGDVDKIIDPEEIVKLIEFILNQPEHTLYKKVVLFPINEWH
jgi:3-hydroxy acid dehydrogenase / malonic semialdehyde reductase